MEAVFKEASSTLQQSLKTLLPVIFLGNVDFKMIIATLFIPFISQIIGYYIEKINIKQKPKDGKILITINHDENRDTIEKLEWFLGKYCSENISSFILDHYENNDSGITIATAPDVDTIIVDFSKIGHNWKGNETKYIKNTIFSENSIFVVKRKIEEKPITKLKSKNVRNFEISSDSRQHLMEFIAFVSIVYDRKNMISGKVWVPCSGGWTYRIPFSIKTFKNIYISDHNMEIKNIIHEWKISKDEHIRLGIPYKQGFCFYGDPGNGKSSTAYAIGHELDMQIYRANVMSVSKLENVSNSVIFFDDFDIDCNRGKNEKEKEKIFDLNTFLELFDGYTCLQGCIVIIATNYLDRLDPALIRPGRINHCIEFKNCVESQFRKMYYDFIGEKLPKDFIFPDGKYSTSYLINSVLIPYKNDPKKIIEMVSSQ